MSKCIERFNLAMYVVLKDICARMSNPYNIGSDSTSHCRFLFVPFKGLTWPFFYSATHLPNSVMLIGEGVSVRHSQATPIEPRRPLQPLHYRIGMQEEWRQARAYIRRSADIGRTTAAVTVTNPRNATSFPSTSAPAAVLSLWFS